MIEAPIASRQVSVAEAAVLLGVSVDTIKRRVRSGALQSTRTAQGRVLVTLPEEAVAPQAPQEPMSAPQDAPQTQGNDADAAALLERVTTVTAERDWLRDRVERAESEREQLRILLSNAQQSLVRALQAAPQTAPPSSVEAPGAPQPAEPTMGSLQARLRVLAPWVLLAVILLLAFAVGQPAWVR